MHAYDRRHTHGQTDHATVTCVAMGRIAFSDDVKNTLCKMKRWFISLFILHNVFLTSLLSKCRWALLTAKQIISYSRTLSTTFSFCLSGILERNYFRLTRVPEAQPFRLLQQVFWHTGCRVPRKKDVTKVYKFINYDFRNYFTSMLLSTFLTQRL